MQEIGVSNLIHFRIHFSAYLRGFLTLNVPCASESRIEIKIKLNVYFHTSLWCLQRFYEGL